MKKKIFKNYLSVGIFPLFFFVIILSESVFASVCDRNESLVESLEQSIGKNCEDIVHDDLSKVESLSYVVTSNLTPAKSNDLFGFRDLKSLTIECGYGTDTKWQGIYVKPMKYIALPDSYFFQKFPQIEEFSLTNCGDTKQLNAFLASMPKLKKLSFSSFDFSHPLISFGFELVPFLEELEVTRSFTGNSTPDSFLVSLDNVQVLKHLKSLDLSFNRKIDKFEYPYEFYDGNRLRGVTVNFPNLNGLSSLENLQVGMENEYSSVPNGEKGYLKVDFPIGSLSGLTSLKNIDFFEVHSSRGVRIGKLDLSFLEDSKALEFLSLRRYKTGDPIYVDNIMSISLLKNLKEINANISSDGSILIESGFLSSLKNLEVIDLSFYSPKNVTIQSQAFNDLQALKLFKLSSVFSPCFSLKEEAFIDLAVYPDLSKIDMCE